MKEKLNTLITISTRLSTVIFLIDSIALLAFKGKDACLSAVDVLVILGIALICGLLYVLILSDKNVSKKKMFLLQLLYIAIVNVIVLAIGHFLKWFSFCHIKTFLVFESVIIGVCVITLIYSYKCDSITAKKMTEKLKDLNDL